MLNETKLKIYRLLLLGDENEESSDSLIEAIYQMALKRLLFIISITIKGFLLGSSPLTTLPNDLEWILDEVVVKRFNRIGSEGYKSQSVEGHNIQFDTMDFAEYLEDITKYYDPHPTNNGFSKGKAVLI